MTVAYFLICSWVAAVVLCSCNCCCCCIRTCASPFFLGMYAKGFCSSEEEMVNSSLELLPLLLAAVITGVFDPYIVNDPSWSSSSSRWLSSSKLSCKQLKEKTHWEVFEVYHPSLYDTVLRAAREFFVLLSKLQLLFIRRDCVKTQTVLARKNPEARERFGC